MNQELAKFCGIQWHKEIKTESKLSCSCGKTYAFSAPAHKEFIDSTANSELHKRFACTNPDFAGKDFHLLHTAMGETGQWDRLGAFLAVHDEDFPYDSLLAEVELHRRSFAEQVKIIHEFIKEERL